MFWKSKWCGSVKSKQSNADSSYKIPINHIGYLWIFPCNKACDKKKGYCRYDRWYYQVLGIKAIQKLSIRLSKTEKVRKKPCNRCRRIIDTNLHRWSSIVLKFYSTVPQKITMLLQKQVGKVILPELYQLSMDIVEKSLILRHPYLLTSIFGYLMEHNTFYLSYYYLYLHHLKKSPSWTSKNDAFDLFNMISSGAINGDSLILKELSLHQRDFLG